MNYRLLYFASLADLSGCTGEVVRSDCRDVRSLYDEIAGRYRFTFKPSQLRVAVNGNFADWTQALTDNDEVVFLPPVSGG